MRHGDARRVAGAHVVAVWLSLGREVIEPGLTDRVVVAEGGDRRIGAPGAATVPVHGT
jgi:hypothetical protein